MNKSKAIRDIQSIFQRFKALTPVDRILLSGLNDGKLYELYVLSELLLDLQRRGCQCRFIGNTLKFKAAPGKIKLNDPHFEVITPNGARFRLFVSIEFQTLGDSIVGVSDRSALHELDLVVLRATPDYPGHEDIVLAVECKSTANFKKKVVKEALGIRRELSYFVKTGRPSLLTTIGGCSSVMVAADPASEFWLAFIHGAGTNYAQSPDAFGIDFKHIEP